ncbi:MAG: nucleotidyl transferase AbiEii/AbiGii toxin family protein [Clostridia bacterium]|nr:nucleotidyl transferase AbiEii/AbiGii toxin family protein [Clostridia bacterium]
MLAEKIETLLARGTANTRMRDFYDIYVLTKSQTHNIDNAMLRDAFINTSEQRGSISLLSDTGLITNEISESTALIDLWKNYQRKFDYAADVLWGDVMEAVRRLIEIEK